MRFQLKYVDSNVDRCIGEMRKNRDIMLEKEGEYASFRSFFDGKGVL